MMMMMMNCFCGMVDRRKALSLISSRDHCQRSSPSRISDTLRAGFETAQNLSSGFVEWSCAVVITTTPRRQHLSVWFTTVNQEPTHILTDLPSCIDLLFTSQSNIVMESVVHSSFHQNCHIQIIYANINLKLCHTALHLMNVKYGTSNVRRLIKFNEQLNSFLRKNYLEV